MRNRLMAALVIVSAPALAHVTLTEKSAKPGTSLVAHFHVGHGCSGSPTTALQIEMPASLRQLRPDAKPGWTATVETKPGIQVIRWTGGSLPADQSGDFVVTLQLPPTEGRLLFPTTQICAAGEEHWSEQPGAGAKKPAPLLMVGKTPLAAPMGAGDTGSMPGMDMTRH